VDDELTPQEKFNAESPETMVPRALLQGRRREDIVADLVRLDWTPGQAQALLARVARDLERHRASPESRQALGDECRRQTTLGFAIALFGFFLAGVSLLIATAAVVKVWLFASGAMVGGMALGLRGYSRWRLYRRTDLAAAPELKSGPRTRDAR
jgi:hypothetical protein